MKKNRDLLGLAVACAILTALFLSPTWAAEKKAKPTAQPAEWKLPKGTDVVSDDFYVLAGGRYVFFTEVKWNGAPQRATIFRATIVYWMFEPRTGKLTEVEDFLRDVSIGKNAEISQVKPSPDGKYALILTGQRGLRVEPPVRTAFLVTLKDRKVRKLTQAMMIMPCWVGKKVALSTVDKKGIIQPIRLFDPAGGTWTDLKICGMISDADEAGKVIIAACNPDNLSKPMSMQEFGKAQIVTMTAQGKVLRRLCQSNMAGTKPQLSPKGKYVTFQKHKTPPAPGRPPTGLYVQVASATGKEAWVINEVAMPVSVSDEGVVVTIGAVFEMNGAPIKLWDKQGKKSRTLVSGAKAATVSGGRLFYVTPGKQPVIKSMPLP